MGVQKCFRIKYPVFVGVNCPQIFVRFISAVAIVNVVYFEQLMCACTQLRANVNNFLPFSNDFFFFSHLFIFFLDAKKNVERRCVFAIGCPLPKAGEHVKAS